MRIALTFVESGRSFHSLARALASLGHVVTPLEVSGPVDSVVGALRHLAPDLVVHVATDTFYPALYEHLGIAHVGNDASTLGVCRDRALAKRIVAAAARVPTPASQLVRHANEPVTVALPVVVKPNTPGRGSCAVVTDEAALRAHIAATLSSCPDGALVEQLVDGVDVTVTSVAGDLALTTDSELDAVTAQRLRVLAPRVFATLDVRRHGHARFRVAPDGKAYFLDVDAAPALEELTREQLGALVAAARRCEPVLVASR